MIKIKINSNYNYHNNDDTDNIRIVDNLKRKNDNNTDKSIFNISDIDNNTKLTAGIIFRVSSHLNLPNSFKIGIFSFKPFIDKFAEGISISVLSSSVSIFFLII